jgi:hypothetical protein
MHARPDHSRSNASGQIAIADQPDARAGLANVGDLLFMSRPI